MKDTSVRFDGTLVAMAFVYMRAGGDVKYGFGITIGLHAWVFVEVYHGNGVHNAYFVYSLPYCFRLKCLDCIGRVMCPREVL